MADTSYKLRQVGSSLTTGKVTADLFGSIIVNKYGWSEHIAQAQDIGLTFFRFPGGTISEKANVVDGALVIDNKSVTLEMLEGDRSAVGFDITHPELYSPDALFVNGIGSARSDVATFSEALSAAIAGDMAFNLILPVSRYYEGQDFTDLNERNAALKKAVADVIIFAERLKSGAYNGGTLPKQLLFDIGNEPYDSPIEYAIVAKAIIKALSDTLSGSDIKYEIGFQMGTGSVAYRKLLEMGYFDKFAEVSSIKKDDLESIGIDVRRNLDFPSRIFEIDRMMIKILGDETENIDYLRHHNLGASMDVFENRDAVYHQRTMILDYWQDNPSVRKDRAIDLDYYVSAWTTDGGSETSGSYSLAAAGNILALYRNFLESGVDRAALWGLVGDYRYETDSSSETVISDLKSGVKSPQYMLLKLMAENLIDADLLEIGSELHYDNNTKDDFLVYAFDTIGTYTVFVTVGDIDDKGLSVKLDVSDIAIDSQIETTHLDSKDGSSIGEVKIESDVLFLKNGFIELEFDQSFEIVMLSIPKTSMPFQIEIPTQLGPLDRYLMSKVVTGPIIGTDGSETLIGAADADVIFGGRGNDKIDGGGRTLHYVTFNLEDRNSLPGGYNGDFLFGGAGNDEIFGNDGNDWISGGSGNDFLSGGGGFDTFVFEGGHDTINDFTYQVDSLLIDASVTSNDRTLMHYLIQIAEILGNDVVLNFGPLDSLRIVDGADHLEFVMERFSSYEI